MSTTSPSNVLGISQEELDRLTTSLAPDEPAALELPEAPAGEGALMSPAERDAVLSGQTPAGDEGTAKLALSQADLDALGFAPNPMPDLPPLMPLALAPTPTVPARPAPAPAAPLTAPPTSQVRPVQFAPLAEPGGNGAGRGNIDLLLDVELKLTAELGQTRLSIREIMDLGTGSIVELNRLAGEPVDIMVNNTLIAKGEVVVVDEKFGVRILDVVSTAKRVASFS